MDLFNPLNLDMDQIVQSAAPSSHLGRCKELQRRSFLFPLLSNPICHSRGAASTRRRCALSGDGRFHSSEWIPLGSTVCDMGLTVIFSTVTPPHERRPCVAVRGFNEDTFQLKSRHVSNMQHFKLHQEFIASAPVSSDLRLAAS